jgi:hypothetical protein
VLEETFSVHGTHLQPGAGTVLPVLTMRLFESGAREDVNKLENETEQRRKVAAEDVRTTQSHEPLARQLSNLLVELRIIRKDFIYFRLVNFFLVILFFVLGAAFLMAARWIGFHTSLSGCLKGHATRARPAIAQPLLYAARNGRADQAPDRPAYSQGPVGYS